MENQCIDKKIGALLRYSQYSIRSYPLKKRKIYQQHLANCSFCRNQTSRYNLAKIKNGFIYLVIGFSLFSVGSMVPFRWGTIFCFIIGSVWIGAGVVKLVRK